ncbi:MAG: LysM peptidoglycan-binding domain-containing protein [Bacteroidales bacterium]|nr:LysM peptidoglycan-binding domain-containing protein [Bacteroidales bacterium]MDT8432460.1 LysM peptidoglycan-binding domain-containing protein [Bacteroidales bacterium]
MRKALLLWSLSAILFTNTLYAQTTPDEQGQAAIADTVPAQEEVVPAAATERSPVDIPDIRDEVYELRLEQNIDSLLNIYYINQSLESMVDDAAFEVHDSLVPDFPDSVYIERLSNIPSVIDLSYNRLVKNYINVYTIKRRDQVRYMLAVSDFYFPIFEEVFDQHGVPYELKYLAIIESALNPRAVSRAGAVGTWQFMYGTARMYGLRINSLVDERKDYLASTHAAAKFLKRLYAIYGDWTLALAAYNCGPGNVNKAIRRSGGKRDFWEIYYYLPRETRGYVPAFIAATYTMNYYPEHFLGKEPLEIELHTDTIMISEKLHLQQVSEVLKIPVKQLRDLNPQYRFDIIPATSSQRYSLAIPVSQVGAFIDLQDSIMAYKDSVYFNKEKMITSPSSVNSRYQVDLPADKYDKLFYTVKSGDNVGYIADWYDVRTSDLRYWNNISRNLIRSGQKLTIYKPKGHSARYKDMDNMTFTQKQQFAGRTVSSTASSASSASSVPTAGASSGSEGTSPGGSGGAAGDEPGEFIYYTVRSGDTLWDIAQKYPGVSDTDISRWNNLSNSNRIKPGQKIRIRKM